MTEVEDINTNEQPVTETPVANTEVETAVVEETQVQTETQKFFKSFKTEDEWKNYETSLNNKFSTNMLKEFNVSSAKELHDTISNYQKQLTAYQEEIAGLKQDSALANVDDDFREDALALAQAKCLKNPELNLSDAVKEVLTKNPTWSKGHKVEKLGTERAADKKMTKTTDGVLDAFLKRNPNLKGSLLDEDE